MATLNPIIKEGLGQYFSDNPDIPKKLYDLIEALLKTETHDSISKDGIDKIYEQILDKYIQNEELMKWSEEHG